MDLLVAIDGGGTSCRAAIAEPGGRVVGRATTGSANVSTDPAGAVENIVAATRAALADGGAADFPIVALHAYLGLAGVNVNADADAFAARLPLPPATSSTIRSSRMKAPWARATA